MTASVIMLAIKTKIRFVISVCRAGASPAGWKSGKSDAGLAEALALQAERSGRVITRATAGRGREYSRSIQRMTFGRAVRYRALVE
jgi:hypothetical protein